MGKDVIINVNRLIRVFKQYDKRAQSVSFSRIGCFAFKWKMLSLLDRFVQIYIRYVFSSMFIDEERWYSQIIQWEETE